MPALVNPRHEQFVQALLRGLSLTEAYISAGYVSSNASSSAIRLSKEPKIAIRHAECRQFIQDNTVESIVLTRNWVIDELIDNVKRCKKAENGKRFDSAGANKALELLGKELGMFVDRSENINWDGDPRKLSAAQLEKWTAYWQGEVQKLGGEEAILKNLAPGVDLLAPEKKDGDDAAAVSA